MPWSNQNGGQGSGGGGGGWKGSGGGGGGGGGGPWGQGPLGGGNQPDLEELLKRSQDRIKQVMPGGGMSGPLLLLIAAPLVALAIFWTFTFRVNPDELGVVMRFGEFVRQEQPGLHLRWPPPIEEVYKPRVTRQNTTEIGMRTSTSTRGYNTSVREQLEESLMLTGDENIVDVACVVFWSIKDASKYLFNIQNPDNTVKEVAESAMREVVGQSNIQPILTEARQKTEAAVQKLMQDTLDTYGSGVRIDQVQLQKVDPPEQVIGAFRSVQAARAEKETLQNKANAYANKVVAEAKGEADRMLLLAEAYKQQAIAEATGEAARFVKVFEEYKKAPDITRRRIYLETMEKVFSGTDKIILDSKAGNAVTPFLPLDQLQRPKPQTPGSN